MTKGGELYSLSVRDSINHFESDVMTGALEFFAGIAEANEEPGGIMAAQPLPAEARGQASLVQGMSPYAGMKHVGDCVPKP